MPRRRRHDVVAVALVALASGAAACQAESGDAGCQLTQATMPGTPLTLLQTARLDQVGGGYFLLGTDGMFVRWGAVSATGTLSAEQAYALPGNPSAVYFAMAGYATPGDTVLIGTLGPDSAGTGGVLTVIAVPADGSPPAAPATTVQTFPGGVPSPLSLDMISSRAGMNAGFTWIDSATGQVMVTSLNGAGTKTGAGVATTLQSAPPYSCLRFSPGKDDLTVVYYAAVTGVVAMGTSAPLPGWIVAEANEGGSVDSITALAFTSAMSTDGCARVTPTAMGYGIAWQDTEGDWLATYTAQGNNLSSAYPFASAASFGGANVQPPLVGLAPFGTDFGALLARPLDVELWRLDNMGNRKPGALVFPSVEGILGNVSALPVISQATGNSSLVVTYADYLTALGVTPAMGSRVFANAVCY